MTIAEIKKEFGLQGKKVFFSTYGSSVYGTDTAKSDLDLLCVVPDDSGITSGLELHKDKVNVQFHTYTEYQKQLDLHKIVPLECYFNVAERNSFDAEDLLCKNFKFNLNLQTLRHSFSEKASNSFVKAKKKIDKEHEFYIGWKSLFHSLRILKFGIQLAKKGEIYDFAEANHYWDEIITAQQYVWEYYKVKYQPIYNSLATEFRQLAPKL